MQCLANNLFYPFSIFYKTSLPCPFLGFLIEIFDKDYANEYDSTLDIENAKEYGQYEFLQACQEMGIVKKDL